MLLRPERHERCAHDAVHGQRTPGVRVAGVAPVVAEHIYVAYRDRGRRYVIIRGRLDIRLVEPDAVNVHAAAVTVVIGVAQWVGICPDFHRFALDRYYALDEVVAAHLSFGWSLENDDVPALGAVE